MKPWSLNRFLALMLIAGAGVAAAIAVFPISTRSTRLGGAALAVLIPVLLSAFLRAHRVLRLVPLAAVLGALLVLVAPGRAVSIADLRAAYLRSLMSYEDTRYVWGGETGVGIDCSGLVRKGLVNAALEQGIRTLNPTLVRLGMKLWWHDATAQALGEGYHGFTTPIGTAPSIVRLSDAGLAPGDLAVTRSGVHVLAYLGASRWIQADPNENRVLVVDGTGDNRWLSQPVVLCRWSALEERPPPTAAGSLAPRAGSP